MGKFGFEERGGRGRCGVSSAVVVRAGVGSEFDVGGVETSGEVGGCGEKCSVAAKRRISEFFVSMSWLCMRGMLIPSFRDEVRMVGGYTCKVVS